MSYTPPSGNAVNFFGVGEPNPTTPPVLFHALLGVLTIVGAQVLADVVQAATAEYIQPREVSASQALEAVAQSAGVTSPLAAVAAQGLAGVGQTATAGHQFGAFAAQTLSGVAQSSALAVRATAQAAQAPDSVTQAATIARVRSGAAAQALGNVAQSAQALNLGLTRVVFAAQLLAPVAQSAAGTVLVFPDSPRMFTVQPEARGFVVDAENRTFTV